MKRLIALLFLASPIAWAQTPDADRWRAAAQAFHVHKACSKYGFKVDYARSADVINIVLADGRRRGHSEASLKIFIAADQKATAEHDAIKARPPAEQAAFYKQRCGELAQHPFGSRFIQEK